MKNKYERIRIVRSLGLNTENSILVTSKDDLDSEFIRSRDSFSVRTFNHKCTTVAEEYASKSVHLATCSKEELFAKADELFVQDLHLIVADKIDPADCEFRGACMKDDKCFTIDIAVGPGTVRDVTNKHIIDYGFTNIPFAVRWINFINSSNADAELLKKLYKCIEQFRKVSLHNIIFEFSWYKIPVGINHENFICWEITTNGIYDRRTCALLGVDL